MGKVEGSGLGGGVSRPTPWGGGVSQHALRQTLQQTATAVGGTHPTGMHYCFESRLVSHKFMYFHLGKDDTGIYDCNVARPEDGALIGIKKFNVTSMYGFYFLSFYCTKYDIDLIVHVN